MSRSMGRAAETIKSSGAEIKCTDQRCLHTDSPQTIPKMVQQTVPRLCSLHTHTEALKQHSQDASQSAIPSSHTCAQLLPASDSHPISPTCSTQASPALPTCVHTGFLLSQRERGKQIQKKMHSAQCYLVMLRVS